MPDGSVAHAGNTEFDATYVRDVGALLDTLSATGAPVVVIKPPCYGESHLVGTDPQIAERRDVVRLAAIDTAWTQAARRHGARMLDLDPVLCPGGIADAAVRPDGAHFDGAGADRVAPGRGPGRQAGDRRLDVGRYRRAADCSGTTGIPTLRPNFFGDVLTPSGGPDGRVR